MVKWGDWDDFITGYVEKLMQQSNQWSCATGRERESGPSLRLTFRGRVEEELSLVVFHALVSGDLE